ncbi:MAG: pyruvate kinase [Mariprofundaceae bacterium]
MGINTNINTLIYRRTKIIATIGPASWEEESIGKLIKAGANIFRLNMSHGDHKSHTDSYNRIRKIAAEMEVPVAIMADLCGPKIRVGKFPDGPVTLKRRREVILTTRDVSGSEELIPCQYRSLHREIKPGERILLNDGIIELRTERIKGQDIFCTVVHGGKLSDHKGINLPDTTLSTPALTEKDRDDARFALKLGVEFLALSFVRHSDDIDDLRELIIEEKHDAGIIAKIERPEALDNIDAILNASNAIMVARGDLGVELPPEQVPMIQQQLIDLARAANKPVIVATQMLESMIDHSQPTRAEVADVAHAVSAGVDAIMLSAETASGSHPVRAVMIMDRIARRTESYQWHSGAHSKFVLPKSGDLPLSHAVALARATTELSHDLLVHAIVVISATGASTRAVSSARPFAPVVAITSNEIIYRRMNLIWGVIPILVDKISRKNFNALARKQVKQKSMAKKGDNILLVRGFHPDPQKSAPSITILCI